MACAVSSRFAASIIRRLLKFFFVYPAGLAIWYHFPVLYYLQFVRCVRVRLWFTASQCDVPDAFPRGFKERWANDAEDGCRFATSIPTDPVERVSHSPSLRNLLTCPPASHFPHRFLSSGSIDQWTLAVNFFLSSVIEWTISACSASSTQHLYQ